MSARPAHRPGLGAYLASFKKTKDRKGWRAEASLALRTGHHRLNVSQFNRIARGQTKYLDREVLEQFAAFYELDYRLVVAAVVQHTYGVTLGDAPDSDPSHVLELQHELAAKKAECEQLQAALARLNDAFEAVRGHPSLGRQSAQRARTGS